MTKYKLEIDTDQAKIIDLALDLYTRIGQGMFEEILWHPRYAFKTNTDNLPEARIILDRLKKLLTGNDPNVYDGMGQLTDEDHIAYDLHQVIRYRLAWDENPKGDITVDFGKPLKYSNYELAKMEKIDG